jgi:hypothetical protein
LYYWFDDVVETHIGMCTTHEELNEMQRKHPDIDKEIFEAQRKNIK